MGHHEAQLPCMLTFLVKRIKRTQRNPLSIFGWALTHSFTLVSKIKQTISEVVCFSMTMYCATKTTNKDLGAGIRLELKLKLVAGFSRAWTGLRLDLGLE